MKNTHLSGGTLGLLAVAALFWGCSDKAGDCNANLSCGPFNEAGNNGRSGNAGTSGGSSGTGGNSSTSGRGGNATGGGAPSGSAGMSGDEPMGDAGAAGSTVTPPTCDSTLSPDADACVISDDYALFVSPGGSDDDTADGTIAHPYLTLTKALSEVGTRKRVYVCAADYAELSTLEIPDRTQVYGGFSCEGGTWSYSTVLKAHLLPASPVGATITSATHGVTLQDIRIDAQNAPDDGTGASSFGLIVKDSKDVLLRRVEIRAGKGGLGKAGTDGAVGADGVASGPEQNGKAGSCTNAAILDGGKPLAPVCMSQGGKGGSGNVSAAFDPGQNGSNGTPAYAPNFGAGGTPSGPMMSAKDAAAGLIGATGLSGTAGAAAPAIGAFSATGYTVASGGNGTAGKPGQGGGGGGASLGSATCVGSSGGAGGMGGCGGDPGTGGKGGGASIGLFSFSSTISLDGCSLVAGNGGAGGVGGMAHGGGLGAAGGSGGAAVPASLIGAAGAGGPGGTGGNGGNGAGGSGGPSLALVYRGMRPTMMDPSTFAHGVGGALGKGGQLGPFSATWGPDGQVGMAKDEYEIVP